jgi:hypothetical protein
MFTVAACHSVEKPLPSISVNRFEPPTPGAMQWLMQRILKKSHFTIGKR